MSKARELLNQLGVTSTNEAVKDELGRFWVVTYPTPAFTQLVDILFEVDVFGFARQIQGGLDERDVILITTKKDRAKLVAEQILVSSKKEV